MAAFYSCGGIVPALAIYVGVMVWLSTFIMEVHFLLDLLFFTVAGLAWIPGASAVVKWLARRERMTGAAGRSRDGVRTRAPTGFTAGP